MRLGKTRNEEFVPNNVCALMFAKDTQQIFPGSYVHFLRYAGTEEKSGKEYNVTKDRCYVGLLDAISETANTVDATLREFTEFRVTGILYSVPEYPRDAWYN